jgi:5S rRNA maturation endonuclease (ribonuclease M5)
MSLPTEQFILAELSRTGRVWAYDNSHRNILVICPWHVSDSARSLKLSISITGSQLHCWSCDARGSWNKFAEATGLQKIDWRKVNKASELGLAQLGLKEMEEQEVDPEIPADIVPWTGSWRGLSEEFLGTIPSYKWFDYASNFERILWPVNQFGKLTGVATYAAEVKDLLDPLAVKQRNSKGPWTRKALFPIDHSMIKDRVVLTEGQYDALRLMSKGVPAVCIFGTGNWKASKASILAGKGIKKVILAFDADEAGLEATSKAYDDLKEGFDVRVMSWPAPELGEKDELGRDIKQYDPGNAPDYLVRVIKRML